MTGKFERLPGGEKESKDKTDDREQLLSGKYDIPPITDRPPSIILDSQMEMGIADVKSVQKEGPVTEGTVKEKLQTTLFITKEG